MIVEVQITIRGSRAAVWAAITDIEHAADFVSGIQKIEVLERPARGLVGFKWRETRMLFGKPASADKWITEAVENEHYSTKAQDGGFVFVSTMRVDQAGASVVLTSTHVTQPQTFGAKVMSIPMKLFFKGVARKALMQDLVDIKAAAERGRKTS
jgi:uncharacterized protein YndB with AHSA1/START domain